MLERTYYTRRDFVRGAAAGAALLGTGALFGCAADAEETPVSSDVSWDREADVVVVGGGGAGLAAAIEAGKAGAAVLVVEKEVNPGGDTFINGGIVMAHGDRMSRELGINLTDEEVLQWWEDGPHFQGVMDPEVAKVCALQAGATCDWLLDLGVQFEPEVTPDVSYTPLPVKHRVVGGGAGFREPLLNAAAGVGAEILTESRATQLIENADGRVIGVQVISGGSPIKIKAKRGVVLTTGGFAANAEMISAFRPDLPGIGFYGSPGITGDGLRMAARLGVMTTRNDYAPVIFPAVGVEKKTLIEWSAVASGGIMVGEDARRFAREDLATYGDLPVELLKQLGKQEKDYYILIMIDNENLEMMKKIYDPKLYVANTIEELAPMVELDAADLKATVDAYNADCAQGTDSAFGRAEGLIALDKPPFYAAKVVPNAFVTTGGIKYNTEAQPRRWTSPENESPVLEPVPGLYTAGLVGEWNAQLGWTISSCFTMGRIAGQNAAAEQPWS